jgi:hypothetical protein
MTGNTKTSAKGNVGYYRLKHNKSWFDDQRKQANLRWLQNPSQINRDNAQNLRHETSRTFRKGISERQD